MRNAERGMRSAECGVRNVVAAHSQRCRGAWGGWQMTCRAAPGYGLAAPSGLQASSSPNGAASRQPGAARQAVGSTAPGCTCVSIPGQAHSPGTNAECGTRNAECGSRLPTLPRQPLGLLSESLSSVVWTSVTRSNHAAGSMRWRRASWQCARRGRPCGRLRHRDAWPRP